MTKPSEDIHRVSSNSVKKSKKFVRKLKAEKHDTDRNQISTKSCPYCGIKHKMGKEHCKDWGQSCNICGKKNHFAKMCKTRDKVHRVDEMSGSESSETELLYTVTEKPGTEEVVNAVMDREIYANRLIDNKPVKFHIDCGATVNVLASKYVNVANIKPTKRVLQMWNKTELKPEDMCRVKMTNPKNNRKYSVEFIIVMN